MKQRLRMIACFAGAVACVVVLIGCCGCAAGSGTRMMAPAPWEVHGDGAAQGYRPTGDPALDSIEELQSVERRRRVLLARQRVLLGRENLGRKEYRRAIDQFTGAETVLRRASMSQPTVVRDLKYVRKLLAMTYKEYALHLINQAKVKIEKAKDELDISMLAPAETYIARALEYDATLAADVKRLRKKIKALAFKIEIEIRTRPSVILKQLGNVEEEFRQKLLRRKMKWLAAKSAPHMQKKVFDAKTEQRIAELKLRYDALRQRAGRTYGAGAVAKRFPEVPFEEFKLLKTTSQGSIHDPEPTLEELKRWRTALAMSGIPKASIDSPDYGLYRAEAAFLSGDSIKAWRDYQAYRKDSKALPEKMELKLDRGFHAWLIDRSLAERNRAGQSEAQVLADRKAKWIDDSETAAMQSPIRRWGGSSVKAALPTGEHRQDTDEIWIVARMDEAKKAGRKFVPRADLVATSPAMKQPVALPLKHTSVQASISAFVAKVAIRQTFENPYTEKIDATYIFPLPDDAAVTDFVMVIGKRRIRGLIREREEAERVYREARAQGYRASLLTQERPNVFTNKVANIEPGKEIGVNITYYNGLKYVDGEFEFSLPLVVGPSARKAAANDGDCEGQTSAVSYLAAGERSGHDVSLALDIDAGVVLEKFDCPTHQVTAKKISASRLKLTLSRKDRIPNRDFVVRWKVEGRGLKTALLTHADRHSKAFSLVVIPPAVQQNTPKQSREMIFVIDASASMKGRPMKMLKETMHRTLKGLSKSDSFQIVLCSDRVSTFVGDPFPATAANIQRGAQFIDKLKAEDGKAMAMGLKAAFETAPDPKRQRIVLLLTDGYIGDESEIVKMIKEERGGARVFTFGIGSSVNRHLIEAMAREGRGAATVITPDEDSGKAVAELYRQARYPALTDVEIDWAGMGVADVYPTRVPDILAGRPVLITGRYRGALPKKIGLSAAEGGRRVSHTIALGGSTGRHEGARFLWARNKVRELSAQKPTEALRKKLIGHSMKQSVLCGYTAFLVVDSSRKTDGDLGISMNVPVELPEGTDQEMGK